MDKIEVKINYLDKSIRGLLNYATEHSVGLDLRASIQSDLLILPGDRAIIGTGIAIEIVSSNIAGFIFSRSGFGIKKGLVVAQGVGVIDPDYRGEIKVGLLNTSRETRKIRPKDRIAQLVFMPAYQAKLIETLSLSETPRGEGGFGHTGIR